MSDMLADGLAFLTEQMVENVSRYGIYARADRSLSFVPFVLGKQLLRVDDGAGGVRIMWTDMDVLIRPRDLILPGDTRPLVPEPGDDFFVVMPYDVERFEVFPFGNEPSWRWSDPNQTLYRIHMKYIDSEQIA